jgi:hypothetical protein
MAVGSPLPLLVMLVLLKLGMDLYLHQREHRGRVAEHEATDPTPGRTEPGLA